MRAVKSDKARNGSGIVLTMVVCSLVVLLVSCSGEIVRPSMHPVEDGSSVPELPEPVEGETEAEAFVREYHALEEFAYQTGKVDLLKEFSGPECRICRTIARVAEGVYGAGGSFEGNPAGEIRAITGVRDHEVCVLIEYGPAWVISSSDAEREEARLDDAIIRYDLSNDNGQWRVDDTQPRPLGSRPPPGCEDLARE